MKLDKFFLLIAAAAIVDAKKVSGPKMSSKGMCNTTKVLSNSTGKSKKIGKN